MPKVSQVPTNSSPVLTDTALGDQATGPTTVRNTWQAILSLFSKNSINPYKFNVWRSGATTPGAGIVVFDTKAYDTHGDYSTSTGQFTAPVSGYYQFNATISFSMNGANVAVGIGLFKNGSILAQGVIHVCMYGSTYQDCNTVGGIFYLNAGDTIDVRDAANCGKPLVNSQASAFFSGFLVSVT